MNCRKLAVLAMLSISGFVLGSGSAQGAEICPSAIVGNDVVTGVIATRLIIFENSKLTCNVRCLQADNLACIEFGASGIKLELNGFSMTGPAEPPVSNCVPSPSLMPGPDGIAADGKTDIVIHGPGLIQKFRRHGIFLVRSTKATVKRAVSHHNCFSGLFMGTVTETLVEEVVSARNGSNSGGSPCGGVCITGSHSNRVRRSELVGNGSIASGGVGVPNLALPNDFGVGLIGDSSGNIIEENGIGGNINGVLVHFAANGNVIRKNVITGNPPVQLGSSPAVGADIRDFSPAGANKFEENLCITYTGATVPNPCPNIPQFSGHQNN